MTNRLSRHISNLPAWVPQLVIGLMLTSLIAWTTWASVSSWQHETRITVAERDVKDVKADIVEIKDGQKEQIKKLDEIKMILIQRAGGK